MKKLRKARRQERASYVRLAAVALLLTACAAATPPRETVRPSDPRALTFELDGTTLRCGPDEGPSTVIDIRRACREPPMLEGRRTCGPAFDAGGCQRGCAIGVADLGCQRGVGPSGTDPTASVRLVWIPCQSGFLAPELTVLHLCELDPIAALTPPRACAFDAQGACVQIGP